jgi:hypothetical protein
VIAGCAVGASDTVPDDFVAGRDGGRGILSDGGPGPSDSAASTDGLVRRDAGEEDAGETPIDASVRPDGGGAALCANPSACTAPAAAGTLSGDTASTPVTITGTTSRWVKVHVNENDNSPVGKALSLRAALTSPAGSNFDLFLYDGAPSQCVTPDFSSTTTGPDQVEVEWGESGVLSNGVSDSRDVYVEVRYVGGSCPPSGNWSLTFTGNL